MNAKELIDGREFLFQLRNQFIHRLVDEFERGFDGIDMSQSDPNDLCNLLAAHIDERYPSCLRRSMEAMVGVCRREIAAAGSA
jgi:hypothetical protein